MAALGRGVVVVVVVVRAPVALAPPGASLKSVARPGPDVRDGRRQALSPDGSRLYVGTTNGELYHVDLGPAALAKLPSVGGVPTLGRDRAVSQGRRGNGAAVDCLHVLSGPGSTVDRLLSKCVNGKIELGPAGGAVTTTFVMKGAAGNNTCRCDVRSARFCTRGGRLGARNARLGLLIFVSRRGSSRTVAVDAPSVSTARCSASATAAAPSTCSPLRRAS